MAQSRFTDSDVSSQWSSFSGASREPVQTQRITTKTCKFDIHPPSPKDDERLHRNSDHHMIDASNVQQSQPQSQPRPRTLSLSSQSSQSSQLSRLSQISQSSRLSLQSSPYHVTQPSQLRSLSQPQLQLESQPQQHSGLRNDSYESRRCNSAASTNTQNSDNMYLRRASNASTLSYITDKSNNTASSYLTVATNSSTTTDDENSPEILDIQQQILLHAGTLHNLIKDPMHLLSLIDDIDSCNPNSRYSYATLASQHITWLIDNGHADNTTIRLINPTKLAKLHLTFAHLALNIESVIQEGHAHIKKIRTCDPQFAARNMIALYAIKERDALFIIKSCSTDNTIPTISMDT